MKWIPIAKNDTLPDGYCWFTFEHSDGGRSVKCCRAKDMWSGVFPVAYIPLVAPDPFGGECLPFEPQALQAAIESGKTVKEIIRAMGVNYQRFHNTIRRYPQLKAIWDAR